MATPSGFPLFLEPNARQPESTDRHRLTVRVKQLAADQGLTVSAVTTPDTFPELAEILETRIGDGHLAGLDWFTADRARFSASPRNLQPSARSLLSVGIAYWS